MPATFRLQAFDADGTRTWRDISYIWDTEMGYAWAFDSRPVEMSDPEEAIEEAERLREQINEPFRVVKRGAGYAGADLPIWPPEAAAAAAAEYVEKTQGRLF